MQLPFAFVFKTWRRSFVCPDSPCFAWWFCAFSAEITNIGVLVFPYPWPPCSRGLCSDFWISSDFDWRTTFLWSKDRSLLLVISLCFFLKHCARSFYTYTFYMVFPLLITAASSSASACLQLPFSSYARIYGFSDS